MANCTRSARLFLLLYNLDSSQYFAQCCFNICFSLDRELFLYLLRTRNVSVIGHLVVRLSITDNRGKTAHRRVHFRLLKIPKYMYVHILINIGPIREVTLLIGTDLRANCAFQMLALPSEIGVRLHLITLASRCTPHCILFRAPRQFLRSVNSPFLMVWTPEFSASVFDIIIDASPVLQTTVYLRSSLIDAPSNRVL